MDQFDDVFSRMQSLIQLKSLRSNNEAISIQFGTILELLIDFIQPQILEKVWISILNGISQTIMVSNANRLLSGYRSIANFIADTVILPTTVSSFSRTNYTQSVVLALLHIISSASKSHWTPFQIIFPSLNIDAHIAIIEGLIYYTQSCSATIDCYRSTVFDIDEQRKAYEMYKTKINALLIVEALPSEWALEGSWLLLRVARRANPMRPSTFILPLLSLLINKAFAGGAAVGDVVDMLLLKKSFDDDIARAIINSFPVDALIDVLDLVGLVWGSRLFISRGDTKMQQYLTKAIMYALDKLPPTVGIDSCGSSGLPISILLSTGISAYLDLSDTSARLLGMRVAMKVARHSSQELVFDEVIEADLKLCTTSLSLPSLQSDSEVELKLDVQEHSDTDSELDAFDIADEPPHSACYLRTCLDLLRHHDTDSNAYDKHIQGLSSIPAIVLTNPIDAHDMCSSVMKELVRMSNAFNIDKFDSLRSEAMLSLLTNYPALTVPVCTAAIEGGVMLGCKLLCVHVLIRAAHALSGVPYRIDLETVRTEAESGASLLQKKSANENGMKGKTRITRPLMLAKLSRKSRTFRNSFGPVAQLCFRPIESELLKLLGSISLNRDQDGGIDMLLPTQLLLALAAFTTCAINTPHQQYFIERTLQLAIPLKHNASLSIRRAALMACYAAMESFVSNQSQSQSQSQTSIANFADSPLAMLSNLHNTRRTEVPNRSMNVVADLADWCVATLGVEADKQSRDIMILMVRCAVDLDVCTR